MAWWFHIDICFGKAESLCRKNAKFFADMECLKDGHRDRIYKDSIDLWWLTITPAGFPYEVAGEKESIPRNKQEAKKVLQDILNRLKNNYDYDFLLMDWEYDGIAEDLSDEPVKINGYMINGTVFSCAAVVLSKKSWIDLGKPNGYKNFYKGYLLRIDYDYLLNKFA